MNSNSQSIEDCLRDAAAQGRLVVLTGAGISCNLERSDGGGRLPTWGQLVRSLRDRAKETSFSEQKKQLLEELLPDDVLEKLPGDVLIEASELLQEGFASGEFEAAIASTCTEKNGECSEIHRAIAGLKPSGIITFNYDRAHESAFHERGIKFQPLLYDNDAELRELLRHSEDGVPFLLKAHGCVSQPKSLVLTSTSYRAVLSRNRAYRAFLQHTFVRNTLLMVGFGLRDRDFDQVMTTLEIELGGPVRPHVILTKEPDSAVPEGRSKRAEWAAISARFSVLPMYLPDYDGIPSFITSLSTTPGKMVRDIVELIQSPASTNRNLSHREIERLGPIGRQQVKTALVDKLTDESLSAQSRSEIIYALSVAGDRDGALSGCFVDEIERACSHWQSARDAGQVECVAHALIALRKSRPSDSDVRSKIYGLVQSHRDVYRAMDTWVANNGGVPRLEAYAMAASAEIAAAAAAIAQAGGPT